MIVLNRDAAAFAGMEPIVDAAVRLAQKIGDDGLVANPGPYDLGSFAAAGTAQSGGHRPGVKGPSLEP